MELEQGKKLKEINEHQTSELVLLFTQYCARNGIKSAGTEQEMVWMSEEVILALEKHFPFQTVEEIKMAFEMYEGRKLGQFYPVFNVGHIMGIVNEFLEFKRIELELESRNQKLYQEPEKPKPTKGEEIIMFLSTVKRCWSYAEKQCYDDFSGAFVFDKFKELKIVNLTPEQIKEVQNLATLAIVNDSENPTKKAMVKAVNTEDSFKFRCRCIATSFQIENWIKEGKTFDDVSIIITEKGNV